MEEQDRYIVKLERRRDGKKYYFRHDGCTTARMESSMRMTKEVAQQLAKAITTQHADFKARAIAFRTSRKRNPPRGIEILSPFVAQKKVGSTQK